MKKINDVELFNINLKFQHLKSKRILIYGTGINAKLLIEALQGFNIVGILDRTCYEGYIQEIPIITWDEVTKDTAEVIIIACKRKNFREIFLRIRHYGEIFDMDIYNFSGQNLSSKFYYADYTYEEMECLKFSKQDLFDRIDKHDAISFDLFDTLIMRKVFEPDDIFDIVERKIRKYAINICNFKKKRRTAELNSEGADIFSIYKELKKIVDVSNDEISLIMKEELACEKVNIIPRDSMVEAFNYAIEKGKQVSIISNMYLPHDIIQDILNSLNIKGYNNLLISCEYGKGKSEGLFEVYKEKIGNDKKCLHIGDDYIEDILSAQKYGITAFYINSSLELLKRSKLKQLLLNAHGFENRLMIGLIISKLFNNPFILYNTGGYVPISSIKIFSEVFIAPVIYVYMQKLLEYIYNNEFEGVIFLSRDGYILFNLYEKYKKKNNNLPKSYYLNISRKIAESISQYDDNDVTITIEKSIENIGIDLKKRYLFCELISTGTLPHALNRLFGQKLYGFYLGGISLFPELDNGITQVYLFDLKNNIATSTNILEAVLSSPKSLTEGIDYDENIFYEVDERTSNEIDMILDMQKYIEQFIEEWDNMYENLELIDLTLPNNLLALIDGMKLIDDMKIFEKRYY